VAQQPRPEAKDADGNPILPNRGVVPLLLEIGERRLSVIGTGFYVTRYGSVATAKHVVAEFVEGLDQLGRVTRRGYVLHWQGESELILRGIRRYALSNVFDIAVAEAENFCEKYCASQALMNMRGRISLRQPPIGARLVTFGYPENATLDFNDDNQPRIQADYFEGRLLEYVDRGPGIPYPHYRTSILMPHGTSGGPVFYNGSIVGINCRAWDFGAEGGGEPLSSVVPIQHAFGLTVGVSAIPEGAWELQQIPIDRRAADLTLGELINCGVIDAER
jgi:hypothetical protein